MSHGVDSAKVIQTGVLRNQQFTPLLIPMQLKGYRDCYSPYKVQLRYSGDIMRI